MNVLALDTSNTAMSVGVLIDRQLIGEITINIKRNHSIGLLPAIERLLLDVKWEPSTLERIIVAQGPGSYTGVRMAVTVAKTLAWTLECDLVGISSLATLAASAHYSEGTFICPVVDARRGNIYTGLYQVGKSGHVESVISDIHQSADKWLDKLAQTEKDVYFVGEDVQGLEGLIYNHSTLRGHIQTYRRQVPSAYALAQIGLMSQPTQVHTFVPEYLKLAEAEENWRREHPKNQDNTYVRTIKTVD